MATTVHIPDDLLAKVDARARALKIARNRYIVEALRKALSEQSAWSPAFLEALDGLEPIAGVDELEEAIRSNRSRKAPPRL
jgi:predicted transcriptional regulator